MRSNYAHSEDERLNMSALHVARAPERPGVAELLLAHGAEVNATEGTGRTPLDETILSGHAEMETLRRRHDGKCARNCGTEP